MISLKKLAPSVALAASALVAPAASAKGVAEHVVVVVFDGMRPDFIRPQYCPNLYSLATNGVFFRHHHPAFISTTIVNGTALATGTHPGHSGIIANNDYRQDLGFTSAVGSEALDTICRGDLFSGGKYVAVDTLAEIIQDAGHHTFIAGTKGVTLLHDRGVRKTDTDAHRNSVILGRGLVMPRAAGDGLKKANEDKAFPDGFATPNIASDNWTTRALVRGLWKKGVPKYSLLWLADPDLTQHAKGVGSKESLEGIEASDKNLGELLKELDEKKIRDKTDIFVVSDHGFSAIEQEADIVAALKAAKISASSKNENPEKGDVIVVNLGGAALVYVIERDEAVVRKTAAVLQQCSFTGVLFSRLPIDGTFPMEQIRYDGAGKGSPDFVVAMRWSPDLNENGFPGMIVSTGGGRGGGTHGSLSRYDMNNTLVASGPDLKRGVISEVPSGNIDLAPTVLDLLGIPVPSTMDGRVLRESFTSFTGPAPQVKEERHEAARTLGFMEWKQYLKTSQVDGALYFDEGNGTSSFR
jgi:predicted AlkP superfamily pyrophosphatase or phosphodiesterase